MAWSRRYGRRRGYRRRRYSGRYRSRRSRYGYRRRRRSSTKSAVVKLTSQAAVPFVSSAGYAYPIVLNPTRFPGFMDYYNTYSQFRILKAEVKVHLETLPVPSDQVQVLTNQRYTFLKVSSRPFVESAGQNFLAFDAQGHLNDGLTNRPASEIQVRQQLNALRQSRFQKQFYPGDTRNVLKFRYIPYTLEWAGRPFEALTVDTTNPAMQHAQYSNSYLRVTRPRSWMPMSFTGVSLDSTNSLPFTPGSDAQHKSAVEFYGPYLVRLDSALDDGQALKEWSPVCAITLYLQFRGQR